MATKLELLTAERDELRQRVRQAEEQIQTIKDKEEADKMTHLSRWLNASTTFCAVGTIRMAVPGDTRRIEMTAGRHGPTSVGSTTW